MNTRGQAALEFLTTYGWAFLVILVMIGALAYFGVLNPSGLLPNKCLFGSGIGGCIDYGASGADTMEAIIVNNYGRAIQAGAEWQFTVVGEGNACTTPQCDVLRADGTTTMVTAENDCTGTFTTAGGMTWQADEPVMIRVSCDTGDFGEGGRPKVTVRFQGTPAGSEYVVTNEGVISVRFP